MNMLILVVLGVMGALFGSFACAQVWRLRARQLVQDKKDGEHVDGDEYRRLKGLIRPSLSDRSECLACHHQLAWYDLVPVVSWISLGGKCRYCHVPIGITEILAEIGLGAAFVVSGIFWPHHLMSLADVVVFGLWLVALVVVAILFIYDAKWSLLPFSVNVLFIGVAAVFLVASSMQYGVDFTSLVGALVLLSGLYLLFSLFNWVGMGDGILGVGLAFLVGRWELAFLVLFLANLLGCIMLIPLLLTKRLHRQLRIPFGPFLIVATIMAVLWGDQLIEWSMQASSALALLML